jgi:hypothetical protein
MDQLRVKLLEHIYGPNLGVCRGTAATIDSGITMSLASMTGANGSHLQTSNWLIRKGNTERGEALTLAAKKNPDWQAIDALLKSSRQYFVMANMSHNLHGLDVSLRDASPTEHRESPLDWIPDVELVRNTNV